MKRKSALSSLLSRSTWVVCWVVALAGHSQTPSPQRAVPASLPVVVPVIACEKLLQADLSTVVGAKTYITGAIAVTDGKPAPYCEVAGNVEPAIKFKVRLPLQNWTERFVQTGCGGLCGILDIDLRNTEGCEPANDGQLAMASTDMGHSGAMDGEFGRDMQKRVDFAYRGVHVTALAARALISIFYGQGPRYAYFVGCSDGGREALMEAQRFPEDFDGITAGAPAMNFTTQNTFYHGWNALKNTGQDGKPILTAEKLPILHRAALKACDAFDGLKDGLIENPIGCLFDPSTVQCKSEANTSECLTPAQVEVVRSIYRGAHDRRGTKLVLSGPLPGSELAWAGVYVPSPETGHQLSGIVSLATLSNLVYGKSLPNTYSLKELSFTRESFEEATQLHGLYDATDPDLGPFAMRGGKLILWHGLADPHISPLNTIDYYTAMNRIMGKRAVQQFARLYLFPGGYHCADGEGPFAFDLMNVIMAWVENGSAPFAIIASDRAGSRSEAPTDALSRGRPGGRRGMPLPDMQRSLPQLAQDRPFEAGSLKVDRTRPIFPYPLTARYKGTGSINDASSFEAGSPQPVPVSKFQWMGSDFYRPHFEVWCQTGVRDLAQCSTRPDAHQ